MIDQSITWKTILFEEQGLHISALRKVLLLCGVFVIASTVTVAVFHYQLIGHIADGAGPMLFIPDEYHRMFQDLPAVGDIIGRWLIIMLVINTIIVGGITYYVVEKLGRPLVLLKRYTNALGDGQLNVDLDSSEDHELREITETLNQATARIQLMVMALKENLTILEDEDQSYNKMQRQQALEGCRAALDYFETTTI
ncbi:MAG: HAMP domain-containing protein [Pseudomonadota bacterium]